MCDRCGWEKIGPTIREVARTGKVASSYDFLMSASQWVAENQHVTEKQITAVLKIEKRARVKKLIALMGGRKDVNTATAGKFSPNDGRTRAQAAGSSGPADIVPGRV